MADVGNDLTMTSLQDIDNYQSASGGFSVTFGKPSGSVGGSVSTSKINSEYASVGDQSGLFAGDGGYDIFTGNHTQLNGAVIASTADAASNTFSTGTLGWDSIGNHAEYHASSASFGFSGSFDSSQKPGEQYTASALPALVNISGSASGTTRSAVADGTITVRDTQNQTQDVAGDVSAYKRDAADKEASDHLSGVCVLSQEAHHIMVSGHLRMNSANHPQTVQMTLRKFGEKIRACHYAASHD